MAREGNDPMADASPSRSEEPPSARVWQIWAAVLVALGCLATAGYAMVETFWG
jgi:hypothetical protein